MSVPMLRAKGKGVGFMVVVFVRWVGGSGQVVGWLVGMLL